MTPSEYVNENYNNIKKWLRNTTRGHRPELYEDFVHECMIIFLEHERAQELVDKNQVRPFIVRVALNQWRSVTSPWAKQEWTTTLPLIGDFEHELEEYSLEDDAIMELLIGIMDDMMLGEIEEYYMALVVMVYHELKGNFSEMSRRLDIARTSLTKVYNEGVRTIRERLKEKIEELNNGTITITYDTDLVVDRWNELCSTASRKAGEVHTRAIKRGFFRDL